MSEEREDNKWCARCQEDFPVAEETKVRTMNDNCVEFKAGVYAVILASIALLSCVAISEFSEPSLLSFALILVVLAYYFVGTLILNSRMDYLREEQGKAAPEKPIVT